MRLRKRCAAWLGLAGACVFAIGCGSDVPDPGSDANAAGDSAPAGGGGQRAGAAPAPAVAANDAPKAEEATPAQGPQGGEAPKDQSKGQGDKSATSEMLALSGGPNAPPAGGGSPPPAAPGGAPPPASPPASGPAPGPAGPGGGTGRPTMGPGSPGMPAGGGAGADMGKMMADQMKQQMGQRGGARPAMGGGPGPGGGAAAGGGNNQADAGPADFRTPTAAVRTFLNALKAKDADRLSEATARRAAVESTGKNQDLFSKILEVTLPDSELDDLAKKLDGYQISGENPQKSTGKCDVVVQKSEGNGSYSRRRITARREKKGWGVLDIGPEQVFKMLGARRKTSSGR
jgi:hypothetical protein